MRLVGVLKANVFYVIFVDYFHDLYSDDKKNVQSKKTHNYSIEDKRLDSSLDNIKRSLNMFSEDFMSEGRADLPLQERALIWA